MSDRWLTGERRIRKKDNMGWSDWEEFRRLTPNDKTEKGFTHSMVYFLASLFRLTKDAWSVRGRFA